MESFCVFDLSEEQAEHRAWGIFFQLLVATEAKEEADRKQGEKNLATISWN